MAGLYGGATLPNVNTNTKPAQGAVTPQAAPVMGVPFARAARKHIEQGATLSQATWSAVFQQPFSVPSYGYMSGVMVTITGSGGAKGASGTVAGSADAPWNLLSNVNFTDASSTPIWVLDGYASFLARLLGGYRLFRPDQSTYGYTPIDGTAAGGAGTGNFKVKFFFPCEFGQDGLGCLANMDASQTYKLGLSYNAPATFYSNVPGTIPSISALIELVARLQPAPTAPDGSPQATEPPAAGTVGYWTSQSFGVVSGANTPQLTRVGNLIRNHILVFRDANGVRSLADSTGVTPTVLTFNYDDGVKFIANVDTLREIAYEAYGFDMPPGVIALPYTLDPDNLAGQELGEDWLPTVGSTKLQLSFTSSAPGSLQVITNDIVPTSNAIFQAAAMEYAG